MWKEFRRLTRMKRLPKPNFREYDLMDEYPYVSGALRVYTQETLQVNPDTKRFYDYEILEPGTAVSPKLEEIENAFLPFLNLVVYNVYKYGEFLVLLDDEPLKFVFVPPTAYELDEEGNVLLKAGVSQAETLSPKDYVRFVLQIDFRDFPYGTSILKPARRVWLRLKLIEDAITLYRLTRATSRYVFYVYTGDLSPEEAMKYVFSIKEQVKKNKVLDPRTGDLRVDMNFWDIHDDLWIPVGSDERRVQVDVLQGAPNIADIADMEYFLSQFFGALSIPKAYMGNEYDVNRATLVMQDLRFARVIKNLQPFFAKGIAELLEKALLKWYGVESVIRVSMYMPNVDDIARLDYLLQKAQLIQQLASTELSDGQPLVSADDLRKMWQEGLQR